MPSPLQGPPPALPGPLDRLAERWARLPPRLRIAVVLLLVMLFGAWQANRLVAAQTQWGAAAVSVWRAVRTVPAGEPLDGVVRRVRLPQAAVPATAVTEPIDDDTVLSVALVEGALLTATHLSPVGPAVALPADERAVPVPVEAAWGIEPGVVVDVWAITDRDRPPEPLAQGRPVVQVSQDGPRQVALVALEETDVAATTASLARGRVLLTLRSGGPAR